MKYFISAILALFIVSLQAGARNLSDMKIDEVVMTLSQEMLGKTAISDDATGEKSYIFPMGDMQYEWSEHKTKTSSALLDKKGLVVESKEGKLSSLAASIVEIPFNVESGNFIFGATFLDVKPSDDFNIGLIFDYKNNRNFKAVRVSKNQYTFIDVTDGEISEDKTGLVKYKSKNLALVIERHDGKIFFYLNGMEFGKLSRGEIVHETFGVFVAGKGKAVIPNYTFYTFGDENDVEQSTSDV